MEAKLKYLEFIQNVITRMNTNSFMIKGWMITLVSALFALAAKDANPRFVMITYISIPAFWILDAFYLSVERQYRALYDAARLSESVDFSMDASLYNKGVNTWMSTFKSRTLVALYPTVAVISLLVSIWMV